MLTPREAPRRRRAAAVGRQTHRYSLSTQRRSATRPKSKALAGYAPQGRACTEPLELVASGAVGLVPAVGCRLAAGVPFRVGIDPQVGTPRPVSSSRRVPVTTAPCVSSIEAPREAPRRPRTSPRRTTRSGAVCGPCRCRSADPRRGSRRRSPSRCAPDARGAGDRSAGRRGRFRLGRAAKVRCASWAVLRPASRPPRRGRACGGCCSPGGCARAGRARDPQARPRARARCCTRPPAGCSRR